MKEAGQGGGSGRVPSGPILGPKGSAKRLDVGCARKTGVGRGESSSIAETVDPCCIPGAGTELISINIHVKER